MNIWDIFLNLLIHVNSPFILASFFVNTVGLYYCFYKSWKADPGYISTTTSEQRQVGKHRCDFRPTNFESDRDKKTQKTCKISNTEK